MSRRSRAAGAALTLAATAAVAAAAGLAACGPSADPDAPPPLLTLTDDGVGGLGAATPFRRDAVGAALGEGFAIERGSLELAPPDSANPAVTMPVLYAFHEGEIVLELYPDAAERALARIEAPSDAVAGPRGARVGRTFAGMDGRRLDCRAGRDELDGRAVCGLTDAVAAVFAHGGGSELPEPRAMADAPLERLLWRRE